MPNSEFKKFELKFLGDQRHPEPNGKMVQTSAGKDRILYIRLQELWLLGLQVPIPTEKNPELQAPETLEPFPEALRGPIDLGYQHPIFPLLI